MFNSNDPLMIEYTDQITYWSERFFYWHSEFHAWNAKKQNAKSELDVNFYRTMRDVCAAGMERSSKAVNRARGKIVERRIALGMPA